jgi:ubiquinone/menaquinone biosynthesis C-methylase UbiE
MYTFLDALTGQELQFWNYGYWTPGTENVEQASAQLLEHLVAKLPRTATKVLDVAFGKGTSTLRLCDMYGKDAVTGVNIAQPQIDLARKRGVACELKVMDAARLEFEPDTFDAILCIEAAFHFPTRLDFLKGAHRVLKPGGKLVLSDLFLRSDYGLRPQIFPLENQIKSFSQYTDLYAEAGFKPHLVSIEKTMELQLVPFMANLAKLAGLFAEHDQLLSDTPKDRWSTRHIVKTLLNISDCVIVAAEKEA